MCVCVLNEEQRPHYKRADLYPNAIGINFTPALISMNFVCGITHFLKLLSKQLKYAL